MKHVYPAVHRLVFGSLVCPILACVGHFHMAHSSWPKIYFYKFDDDNNNEMRNRQTAHEVYFCLIFLSVADGLAGCWGISICSNSLYKYNIYFLYLPRRSHLDFFSVFLGDVVVVILFCL